MKRFIITYLLVPGLVLAAGCTQSSRNDYGEKQAADTGRTASSMAQQATVYTCPMHPQVRSHEPGDCPICGMKLEPVSQAMQMDMTMKDTPTVYLSGTQRFFANIHTDTAKVLPLQDEVVLTGVTDYDPRSRETITSWAPGRIERLYVRNPGELIRPGEKLYDLYSEELLSAEKEYLLALQQQALFKAASVDFSKTIEALKQKLLRWGLTEGQLERLQKEDKPDGLVSVYSKRGGYLVDKMKEEGDYVQEGEAVFAVARTRTLWVQAQLYDTELPLLDQHPAFWVELEAFSGKKFRGEIAFSNPVNGQSRVHLLSISIPNPGEKLQPGMLAYVYLETGQGKPALTVPKSAVVYDEKHNYVWVAQSDSTFERREVEVGTGNKRLAAITKGVEPGEVVVSSGVYLLNSEYILRNGNNGMAGMQM